MSNIDNFYTIKKAKEDIDKIISPLYKAKYIKVSTEFASTYFFNGVEHIPGWMLSLTITDIYGQKEILYKKITSDMSTSYIMECVEDIEREVAGMTLALEVNNRMLFF